MREIRSYGSVRGVAGDRYPYRDSPKRLKTPRLAPAILTPAERSQSLAPEIGFVVRRDKPAWSRE